MRARAMLLAAVLFLAGCQTFTLEGTPPGVLRGELAVVWVGEDSFVYVGGPGGLSFRTSDGKLIKPEMIYTDGGSIPRPVRALDGFSPWGFAPAYIIHDWLFIQRHCNPDYLDKLNITFEDSARILAEVIKTLIETNQVRPNETAFSAISWAVSTSIARDLWEAPNRCFPVTPVHRARVAAALRQEPVLARMRSTGTLDARSRAIQAGQAQVVVRRSYGP